jgi:hypothetical protein
LAICVTVFHFIEKANKTFHWDFHAANHCPAQTSGASYRPLKPKEDFVDRLLFPSSPFEQMSLDQVRANEKAIAFTPFAKVTTSWSASFSSHRDSAPL